MPLNGDQLLLLETVARFDGLANWYKVAASRSTATLVLAMTGTGERDPRSSDTG
jgi:hypothetical protein